jgi:hypothetical protein
MLTLVFVSSASRTERLMSPVAAHLVAAKIAAEVRAAEMPLAVEVGWFGDADVAEPAEPATALAELRLDVHGEDERHQRCQNQGQRASREHEDSLL